VNAEYGSFNFMRGLFSGSGPLIKDSLYLGINGQYQSDDGWIENTHSGMDDDANEEEDRRISGYFLYKPTDRLSARLTVSNDYTKRYWINGYGLPGGTDISNFDRDDAEHVDFDVPTKEEYDSNSQSLNLSYDFDSIRLISTTTHRKLDIEGDYDADFANKSVYAGLMQFNNTDLNTWNQELRFSSIKEVGIRWVGGMYLDVEERDQGPYGMQFPNYDPTTYDFIGNYEMNAESQTDSDTYAIFGQLIVPLGRHFELTLGGRYQEIDKEIDLKMYYLPVGMTGDPMYTFKGDESWDVFLPKVALTYRISNAWTAYASYSRGYMPGGFNYFATAGTEEDNHFEPQESINYELGIKASLDRLRMAASVFYMDIEDIHVYKAYGTMYLTDNAEKAHSQGVELEFTYRPTDTIELSGAAGIIDAEYDDYDAGGGFIFDGKNIQNTPAYTARFGVAYFHPGGFYSRLDMKNQGNIYFYDDYNKAMVKEDAYTVIDAKIGYHFNTWDFFVYGKNLTDEDYITDFKSSSTVAMAGFGEPRTVGVGMRYRF
jgi:iron complex outermembrane receptor protein